MFHLDRYGRSLFFILLWSWLVEEKDWFLFSSPSADRSEKESFLGILEWTSLMEIQILRKILSERKMRWVFCWNFHKFYKFNGIWSVKFWFYFSYSISETIDLNTGSMGLLINWIDRLFWESIENCRVGGIFILNLNFFRIL